MTTPINVQLTPHQAAVVTAYQRLCAQMSLECEQLEKVWGQQGAAMVIANTIGSVQKVLNQFMKDCHTGIVVAQSVPKELVNGGLKP